MSPNTLMLQSQAAAGRAMWFEEHRADLSAPKYTNKMLQLEIHYVGAWGAIRLSGIHCFEKKTKTQDSWEEEKPFVISSQLSKDEPKEVEQ